MATATNASHLTHAQALERSRELAKLIAPHAIETENRRRLSAEIVESITSSGLVEALVPERWGGYGLGWDTLIATSAEIGKVCGSTAWCFSFFMGHTWMVGQFGKTVQEAVWGPGPRTLFGTSFAPGGKVTAVAGGYRLSGRWSWASGIDHCEWITVGGVVPSQDANGMPEARLFTLPRSDYRIDDVWNTAAMRGTGSNDVLIDDVLVAPDFSIPFAGALKGSSVGIQFNPERFWRTPFVGAFPLLLLGPALGIARGAYDYFVEWMKVKSNAYSGYGLSDLMPLQIRIAETAAEIDAAELVIDRAIKRMQSVASIEELQSIPFRALTYRDYVLAGQMLIRAVDRLFAASGARGINHTNPMQRHWRDIHATGLHIGLTADPIFETFGRLELGLPLNPRTIMF